MEKIKTEPVFKSHIKKLINIHVSILKLAKNGHSGFRPNLFTTNCRTSLRRTCSVPRGDRTSPLVAINLGSAIRNPDPLITFEPLIAECYMATKLYLTITVFRNNRSEGWGSKPLIFFRVPTVTFW